MSKRSQALDIVDAAAIGASAGLVSSSVIDAAAIANAQLKLISKICAMYELPCPTGAVKALVGSLLGTFLPLAVTAGSVGSVAKAVPSVASAIPLGVTTTRVYAITYAVGRVFVEHFESGGNIRTFSPETARTRMPRYIDDAEARSV